MRFILLFLLVFTFSGVSHAGDIKTIESKNVNIVDSKTLFVSTGERIGATHFRFRVILRVMGNYSTVIVQKIRPGNEEDEGLIKWGKVFLLRGTAAPRYNDFMKSFTWDSFSSFKYFSGKAKCIVKNIGDDNPQLVFE